MKKTLYFLTVLAALVSCTEESKEIEPQNQGNNEVTVDAVLPVLKTSVNGGQFIWRPSDELGISIKHNGRVELPVKFTKAGGPDSFKGKLAAAPVQGDEWFAFHPYIERKLGATGYLFTLEAGTQQGDNSKAHLRLPVWGYAKAESGQIPEKIEMNHMAGLFEISLTNRMDEQIAVKSITLNTGVKKIAGEWKAFESDKKFIVSHNDKSLGTITLKVENVSLKKDGKATFYVPSMPVTLSPEENVLFTITTDKSTVTTSLKLNKEVALKAGGSHHFDIEYKEDVLNYKGLTYKNIFIDFNKNGKKDNGEVWLDRNIGASANNPADWGRYPKKEDEINSLGFYYYWGRKYEEHSTAGVKEPFAPTRKDAWAYMGRPTGKAEREDDPAAWTTVCPEGYRLPTESEWMRLLNEYAHTGFQVPEEGSTGKTSNSANGFGADLEDRSPQALVASPFKLAMTGHHIKVGSGYVDTPTGWAGAYWSCTYETYDGKHSLPKVVWIGYNDKGNKLYLGSAAINWGNAQHCTASVRCVKDIK